MHREHAEHHAMGDPNVHLVRLEARQMANVTIVVRCGKVYGMRLKLAMALMRLAGRLGGFKQVKLIREKAA